MYFQKIAKMKLKKITILSTLLLIVVQIILIVKFWDMPQGSDQGEYIKLAQDCLNNGEWYPMEKHIYSTYFWAPGLINYFILQMKLFGTINLNMIFNLFMNLCIVYEVYWLAKKFFLNRTAYISVIFYNLIYSNFFVIIPAGTEIPFLFLSLTAFCLCLGNKYSHIIIAGLLFAIANWIRPLIVIFIPVILLLFIYNKYNWRKYLALLSPIFIVLLSIGWLTQHKIGYFCFQSSTSGVNLIMTANDRAYGGVASTLLNDTTNICYIKDADKLTFIEKDSIWKERAINWIIDNPGHYLKLYILKIGGLFVEDSWSDRPILGGAGFVDSVVYGKISYEALLRFIIMFLKSIVYYFVGVCFIYSLFANRKEIFSQKGWLLLILLFGITSTCLFSVSPRYHYPFLFTIVIWAAYGFEHRFIAKRSKE